MGCIIKLTLQWQWSFLSYNRGKYCTGSDYLVRGNYAWIMGNITPTKILQTNIYLQPGTNYFLRPSGDVLIWDVVKQRQLWQCMIQSVQCYGIIMHTISISLMVTLNWQGEYWDMVITGTLLSDFSLYFFDIYTVNMKSKKILSSSWPWPWPTWTLTWLTWSPT